MARPLQSSALVWMVAALLFLAGCGGGDEKPGSTGTQAKPPVEKSDQAPAPESGGRSPAGDGGQAVKPGEKPAGEDTKGSRPPAPRHHDSGGGAAQFVTPGGDNSIQETGEEASEAELQEAAAAVHGFFDARLAEDWTAACSYLSAATAQSLQGFAGAYEKEENVSCADALSLLSGKTPHSELAEAAVIDVGSLRVDGDRAFVIYRGVRDGVFAIPMTREDGGWKLASLGGTPLQ